METEKRVSKLLFFPGSNGEVSSGDREMDETHLKELMVLSVLKLTVEICSTGVLTLYFLFFSFVMISCCFREECQIANCQVEWRAISHAPFSAVLSVFGRDSFMELLLQE